VSSVGGSPLCPICRGQATSGSGNRGGGALPSATIRGPETGLARYVGDWWTLIRNPTLFFSRLSGAGPSRDWLFLLPAWPLGVLAYGQRVLARPHPPDSLGLRLTMAALLAPLALVLGVVILACVHHVALALLRGSSGGFTGSRRVVLYGTSAYSLVHWIPLVGGLLGMFLYARSLVVGFQLVHDASHGRAAVATIAPWLFCVGGLLLL
jgi:hypothetical protein